MARTAASKKKPAPKKSGGTPIFVINRQNLVGWLLVGVMACGLMFVAGVMVGRNTMPIRFDMQQLDEKLANLKQSVLTTKIKAIDVIENLKRDGLPEVKSGDPHTIEPKYGKSGHTAQTPVTPAALDDNSGSEKNPADNADSDEMAAASEKEPAAKPVAAAPPAEQMEKSEPDRNKTARQQAAKPAPTKESGSAAGGGDRYAIQVASLKDPGSAYKVRDRFLEKGYPAYCKKASVNGVVYHRVRIGPYPDKGKARKDFESLSEAGVGAMIFLVDD